MIAIVGDIHLGKKSVDHVKEDKIFQSQDNFFNHLLEVCEARGVKRIIWTGDIFDTTNSVKSNIIQYGVNLFHNKFKAMTHDIILGNHCLYNRDSLDTSSLACLEYLRNVNVYRKMTKVKVGDKLILMVPYLVSEIMPKFVDNVVKIGKQFDAVVGHFDVIGASMESGKVSENGLDMSLLLDNIKLTLSGHYHNVSEYNKNGNILRYVGTPYQLTFGDADQSRGFWLIDDELNMEFVENTISHKFIKTSVDKLSDHTDLSNYFVKCEYPQNLTNEELYAMNKRLEMLSPITFKTEPTVVETSLDATEEELDIKTSEMGDAINDGDILKVAEIYQQVDPPKKPDVVKMILDGLKDKIK